MMRGRRAGFTLLEIMMALGIFGLVAVTLYGTFARTLRSKAIAEQRAEVVRLGRAAVGRMADEIGSAYFPTAARAGAQFRVLKGGTDDTPFDSLVFTALSSRPAGLDGRGTDQRVILYYFPRDRGALRRESRGSDDASLVGSGGPRNLGGRDDWADEADDFFAAFGPTHPPVPGTNPRRLLRREATLIERRALDEASATAFLEDVASLEFRCFINGEWRDTWDSEDSETRGLPRAVAIDLALYDADGEIHHFPTAVDIPLRDTPGASSSSQDGQKKDEKKKESANPPPKQSTSPGGSS